MHLKYGLEDIAQADQCRNGDRSHWHKLPEARDENSTNCRGCLRSSRRNTEESSREGDKTGDQWLQEPNKGDKTDSSQRRRKRDDLDTDLIYSVGKFLHELPEIG